MRRDVSHSTRSRIRIQFYRCNKDRKMLGTCMTRRSPYIRSESFAVYFICSSIYELISSRRLTNLISSYFRIVILYLIEDIARNVSLRLKSVVVSVVVPKNSALHQNVLQWQDISSWPLRFRFIEIDLVTKKAHFWLLRFAKLVYREYSVRSDHRQIHFS